MKSKINNKDFSELARNNKTAMSAHHIDVVVMTIFCVLQALTNLQTWGFVLIVILLGFTPIIAERIIWRKNQESKYIRDIVAIGFFIFYTYTVFTSTNMLVFVFVVPIILVISIYNDTKYSLVVNIAVILENFILVILGAQTGKFGFINADHAIIQIVFLILIGVYSYHTSKVLNDNASQKLERISKSQNETTHLLQSISESSQKTKAGIDDIYEDLTLLNQVSESTKATMQNVTLGANNTATAVQQQLQQTEAIQSQVITANNAAVRITEDMQHTLQVLESGSSDVALLVEKVETSVKNGADVASKLQTLDKYIEEMQSIVSIISGIASQTALLSLNASIEAARAGESGRGFAVVASEISAMATQTNDATSHITNLIGDVSSSIKEVVEVIYQMISSINEEKQSTENTASTFNTIQTHTFSIRDNITGLAANISELKEANQGIADSIQTISAISQELAAHASETMNSEEERSVTLDRISEKMQMLVELANH